MSVSTNSIEASIDGMRLTIKAGSRQQKVIRSGVFWKRFQFARRTTARIEQVKTALYSRNISFDIDPNLFGHESRDEKITFSLLDNDLKQSRDHIASAEFALSNLGEVETIPDSEAYHFSILFRYLFCSDPPDYQFTNGDYGATTSSWTYHTAIAISESCKILDLTCKFESGGKRDALIETRDGEPQVLIAAEWEWNWHDVLGKGKELEKLRDTCRKHEYSHGFLLTYCPQTQYPDFVFTVARNWQQYFADLEVPPTLFLHTIAFDQQKKLREFSCLKTLVISGTQLQEWTDRDFMCYTRS